MNDWQHCLQIKNRKDAGSRIVSKMCLHEDLIKYCFFPQEEEAKKPRTHVYFQAQKESPIKKKKNTALQQLWSQLFLHVFCNSNGHENDWYATKNNDSNNNNNHEICGIAL